MKGWYTVIAESQPVLPVSNAQELNQLVQQYWSQVLAADSALAQAWRNQLILRYGATKVGTTGAQIIFFPEDPGKIRKVGAIMTVNFVLDTGALPGDLIIPARNAINAVANSLPLGSMLGPWTITVSGQGGGENGGEDEDGDNGEHPLPWTTVLLPLLPLLFLPIILIILPPPRRKYPRKA